ncbi:hypothetical protein KAW48_09495, partial [candidate division WOR-3 bacterium]|nr:hypothetical protein [candidate division WOR-3 bacterium]
AVATKQSLSYTRHCEGRSPEAISEGYRGFVFFFPFNHSTIQPFNIFGHWISFQPHELHEPYELNEPLPHITYPILPNA